MSRLPLGRSRSRSLLAGAAVAALASVYLRSAQADGTWVGAVVSFPPEYRYWNNPLNWNGDSLPTSADALFFNTCGDGSVDLGGAVENNPEITFGDWVTYTLTGTPPSGSTLQLMGNVAPQIGVGNTVQATNGSDYFANGNVIATNLDLESSSGTNIEFTGSDGGVLNIQGAVTGTSSINISSVAGGGFGDVYFANANNGYSRSVTIQSNTAARLLDSGRTGTGTVGLFGGRLDILSSTGAQALANTIFSQSGEIFADLNWADGVAPLLAPTTDSTGMVIVDNENAGGGAASITYQANNEFNFLAPALILENVQGAANPTRTVDVENGDIHTGIAGSDLQTGPDDLNRLVVTAQVNSLTDNVAGIVNLTKTGGGVLAIGGNNQTTSEGQKFVDTGTLRFLTANSYGTTTGLVGGPAQTVTLEKIGGVVSAALGIGYPTAVPANLATAGNIVGQSGAFDVDFLGDPAPVVESFINNVGALTGLRLGSSGNGSLSGKVTPYISPAGGATYYMGGGGGSLQITSVLPDFGVGTALDMGTTGTLLPGLVQLTPAGGAETYTGTTYIHAGTLEDLGAAVLSNCNNTALLTYSALLTKGAAYANAGAGAPFNGPGQILLSPTVPYIYAAGGSFGVAGGLTFDGGAVGFTGSIVLNALPGSYGDGINSELYQTELPAAAPVATAILHLGGENSSGTMTTTFAITDTVIAAKNVPVALLKSGINSILNLTASPANTYTGGTGILGGAIVINKDNELGPAPVTITEGGILHVTGGGVINFPQILKVANGAHAEGSVVDVDAGTALNLTGGSSLVAGSLQADVQQSVLEKQGGGVLNILPGFFFPDGGAANSPANTWGLKLDAGVLQINQLPGAQTQANGEAVFAGGTLHIASYGSGLIVYNQNYGFSALTTFQGTSSLLNIDGNSIFRTDGYNSSNLMGNLVVSMQPTSIFKMSGLAGGGTADASGTGSIDFSGGNVQFTPTDAHFLLPQDGEFSLHLNSTASDELLFSGCPNADVNGNLYFNDDSGSTAVSIDAATVDNTPTSVASTWTIAGTGLTSWSGTVYKESTQAIPGQLGPFTTGTVVFDRCAGAPVSVATGSLLQIDAGTVVATGGTDPFTDNSTGATSGNHVAVVNNASFEVLDVNAAIQGITGTGSLTVSDGVTANTLRLATNSGASSVGSLDIVGNSSLDIANNHLFINYGAGPDPIASVAAWLKSGYAGGAWNGPGINSSAAAANSASYGLGFADSADPGNPANLSSGTIEIKYTLLGDANLDGVVDGTDFGILAANFNKGVSRWDQGDFNYDGVVDGADFSDLAANFDKGASGADVGPPAIDDPALVAFAQAHGLMADLPEPASGFLLLFTAGAYLTRRRRKTAGRTRTASPAYSDA